MVVSPRAPLASRVEGQIQEPGCSVDPGSLWHPDAGAYWERKCEGALLACGWTKTGWQGLYMHKETNSLLIVYVDDFRMAAKAEYTPRLWDEIRVKLVTDDPSPPQRFLGVVQHYFEEPVEKLGYILDHNPRCRGREAEVRRIRFGFKRLYGFLHCCPERFFGFPMLPGISCFR